MMSPDLPTPSSRSERPTESHLLRSEAAMLSELQRINTGLSTLNRLPDGGRLAEHLGSKYSDLAPGKSIWRQSVLIMHF